MTDTLTEFYNGKTIFITGAAGFIGTYFLEILLRCFPGIVRIYILLRPKKGVQPQERKEEIFRKKILRSIPKNNPELMEKVQVISGDISMPNLGMSEDDLRKVCDEVTIFFHGAAGISFTKPYRAICWQNAKGTDYVIDVCRKLKKLEVLVFTSTAYANCHIHPETVQEKIYLLPYKAQRFLDEMENGTDESFDKLVASTNFKWINSYCFSKCLSENILLEKASDLPVGIVRPSIVLMAWKGSLPGYVEPGTGVADLSTGVGRGFVKVLHADNDCIFDVVPLDVIVNAHIITAWSVATNRSPSMFIVNCISSNSMKLTFGKYMENLVDFTRRNPLPKGFQEMSVTVVKSKFLFTILTFYQHYIPAIVLDIFLRFKKSQFRLVKLYRFFDKMMTELHPFMSTTFPFQTDNFQSLSNQLSPIEREMIYTDLPTSFTEIVKNLPTGSDLFDWELDNMPPKKRRNVVAKRTMLVTFIKRFTLMIFMFLIYLIISRLFF